MTKRQMIAFERDLLKLMARHKIVAILPRSVEGGKQQRVFLYDSASRPMGSFDLISQAIGMNDITYSK